MKLLALVLSVRTERVKVLIGPDPELGIGKGVQSTTKNFRQRGNC
jgi:hypothetical protein